MVEVDEAKEVREEGMRSGREVVWRGLFWGIWMACIARALP